MASSGRPISFSQRHELAHLVVAIGDVDAHVLVEDLVALDAQFARVGMSDGEMVTARQIIAQHRLLVGTVMDVFRFDEAELARLAPDGARVIDQHLDEKIALVPRHFDDEARIVPDQGRHDVAHDKLLGDGREMDAADARQVRLHEVERILPAGAGEIAHRIEPAIDRVEALVGLGPGIAEPALLVGRDRENGPDALVCEIEVGDALERLDELKTDVMDVAQLLLHDEQRAQHEADGLFDALMLVDQLVDAGVGAQPLVDPRESRVAHMIGGAPYARLERCAGKPEGFSRTENWPHILEHQ